MAQKDERGRAGEQRAAEYLERLGYAVVDRNWRCDQGELDIVACRGDDLVFIEVKTRAGNSTGHPFEAITASKVSRLRRLVPAWFEDHPDVSARAIRIDALAVHVDGDRVGIEHVAGVL